MPFPRGLLDPIPCPEDVPLTRSASDHPVTFAALGVRPPLVRALADRGITTAFPIQAASLPDSLAGRDVLGRGRTGSGKTVAFALPLLERLLSSDRRRTRGRPRALVLVPTRELAVQVNETVEHLARAVGLTSMTVFGGVRYTGQTRRLERGVDVVVATPGRLEDLLEQGVMTLDAVEVIVLDEADLMADMGFLPAVTRVLAAAGSGQRMLFSATLDDDVASLVEEYLTDPLVHSVEPDETEPDAVHYLFLVRHDNKALVLRELLAGGGRTLAFTRTRFGAERLAQQLNEAGIPAADLHGNLRQAVRQRHLASFADGSVSVLVATDIAARGIHVDDIGLVVHVDPPNDPKAFLHRSGRTARAGSSGTVVTLATKSQNSLVRAMMGHAKIKPTQVVAAPGLDIIAEVRAPRVERVAGAVSIFAPDPEDTVDDAEPRGRVSYAPRREPKRHAVGARGPRQDWNETARHPRHDRESAPHRDAPHRDVPRRDDARRDDPRRDDARRDDPRPERTVDRPARPEARVAEQGRPKKTRWTAEDRRKAAESRARGLRATKKKAPGKGKPVRDKDKGKPKPKNR